MHASALQMTGAVLKPKAAARASGAVMGDVSTKKWNEWKFVKSKNDYGKEQTYMFLGPRDDVDDDSAPLASPLVDLGSWSFLVKPYFIILFTPFALAAFAVLSGAEL